MNGKKICAGCGKAEELCECDKAKLTKPADPTDALRRILNTEVEIDEQIINDKVNKWETHYGQLRPVSINQIIKAILELQGEAIQQAKEYYHPSIKAQELQIKLAKDEERERIIKWLQKKYFNDGMGVSKSYSRTATYRTAKELLINLQLNFGQFFKDSGEEGEK